MRRLVVAAGVAALLFAGVVSTTAGAGAAGVGTTPRSWVRVSVPPTSWRCVVEAARLGLFGNGVTLWNHTFVAGTEGPDGAANGPGRITVDADEVYCGLGGDDIVDHNEGIVIGGAGDDDVMGNYGTFHGSAGNDFTYYNVGTVRGGPGDDVVYGNSGFYDGGPGRDVMVYNTGTCVNVEVLSSAPPGTPAC